MPEREFTRRQVLVSCLGAAGLAAIGARSAPAGDPPAKAALPLINHCHVSLKGSGGQRDRPEMGTLPRLVKR